METQCRSYEVFRRSWLTLIPEWCLAIGVLLTMVWSYQRFGLQDEWVGLGLAVLMPIVWIASQTTQWARRTWTVTADGRLIVQGGFPSRSRQVIHLCSARDVEPQSPILIHWLGVGHIAFRATDPRGQVRPFRWTWIGRYRRLCEIIEARGQLPVSRPSWWQLVSGRTRKLVHTVGAWLGRGWALTAEIVARLRGRWFVEDYGRFLAFCHHLLRGTERGRRIPSWVPSAVVRRWMAVLRQARIVVDVPGGKGWQLAGAVRSLEDVCRRIGEEGLRQALQ
jgi:hypothetical protein